MVIQVQAWRTVGRLVSSVALWLTLSAHAIVSHAASGAILKELPAAQGQGLRLVMVAINGCPFCLRFEREVEPQYAQSAEGRIAPLVKVKIGALSLKRFGDIKVTPTFLVLQGTIEIGRIAGYPGRDGFWLEIAEILSQADTKSEHDQ